jgi:thioredoxin 1
MEQLEDRKAYVKATNADGLAILEGTATWCSQCKAIKPFVDEVGKAMPFREPSTQLP